MIETKTLNPFLKEEIQNTMKSIRAIEKRLVQIEQGSSNKKNLRISVQSTVLQNVNLIPLYKNYEILTLEQEDLLTILASEEKHLQQLFSFNQENRLLQTLHRWIRSTKALNLKKYF